MTGLGQPGRLHIVLPPALLVLELGELGEVELPEAGVPGEWVDD